MRVEPFISARRYFNTVYLINQLEDEARRGKAGTLAAQLSHLDLVALASWATCRSPKPEFLGRWRWTTGLGSMVRPKAII